MQTKDILVRLCLRTLFLMAHNLSLKLKNNIEGIPDEYLYDEFARKSLDRNVNDRQKNDEQRKKSAYRCSGT